MSQKDLVIYTVEYVKVRLVTQTQGNINMPFDQRAWMREYQRTHKEENKARVKEWREKNKEKLEEYKEFYKQRALKYAETYRIKHGDKIKETRLKYRQENRELIRQKDRERYLRNKEKVLASQKAKRELKKLNDN